MMLSLILRSIRHYRWTTCAVVAGVAVSCAIVTGALLVGDSIRYTLQMQTERRLGDVLFALTTDRNHSELIGHRLRSATNQPTASILHLRGNVRLPDGSASASGVQVLGVDRDFWKLSPAVAASIDTVADSFVVNERLAKELDLKTGDIVIIRVEVPPTLTREAAVSQIENITTSLRLTVRRIVGDEHFGRFSLRVNHVPPMTAFISKQRLQAALKLTNRVNTTLLGVTQEESVTLAEANELLRQALSLDDYGLELNRLERTGESELRSNAVFIRPGLTEGIMKAIPHTRGVFGYLVNSIEYRGKSVPYSFAAAVEMQDTLGDEETIVNSWLARQLNIQAGDEIGIRYYVLGRNRQIAESSATFIVRDVVDIQDPMFDPELTPAIPGLSDAKSCRDWEPGIPIDLNRISSDDEDYWHTYGDTPKALISLSAGVRLWKNPFGNFTAIRFSDGHQSSAELEQEILSVVKRMTSEFQFQPLREHASKANSRSLDFQYLLIGFSFFLIASSLLLTSLLFILSIEQRSAELGIMKTLGFSNARLSALLLGEGFLLCVIGSVIGCLLAVAYTKLMLKYLSSIWSDPVGMPAIVFHADARALVLGCAVSVIAAVAAILAQFRGFLKRTVNELVRVCSGVDTFSQSHGRRRVCIGISSISIVIAIGLLAGPWRDSNPASIFFSAGTLSLATAVTLSTLLIRAPAGPYAGGGLTVTAFGVRNVSRSRRRSFSIVCLLACGCYIMIGTGAYHRGPPDHLNPESGTGGFTFICEFTQPVYEPMTFASMAGDIEVVPLKVRQGDDASCLNLNRAQNPRLLGVDAEMPAAYGRFGFVDPTPHAGRNPWLLLKEGRAGSAIPAVADFNTIVWSLGLEVGDRMSYIDESGDTFEIEFVGALKNSILQGNIIIDINAFNDRFPNQAGYGVVLFDTGSSRPETIRQALLDRYSDKGLAITTTAERLAAFNAVENTYLSIFQALSGLGLILGTLGLGIVVVRNISERRHELAIFLALGFPDRAIRRLILSEHGYLLILGALCGVAPGVLAVTPGIVSGVSPLSPQGIIIPVALAISTGLAAMYLGMVIALKPALREALLND